VVLVNGGEGFCNAVYVDDVVDAILLAATRQAALGETFLISGEEPVTWREFYRAFEDLLQCKGTTTMSEAEIAAERPKRRKAASTLGQISRALKNQTLRARLLEIPAVSLSYSVTRKVVPSRLWSFFRRRYLLDATQPVAYTKPKPYREPIPIPDHYRTQFSKAKTRVVIDKARTVLGYQPQYDFAEGMKLTAEWARWANLV
jgi:nucleoside-diphosphate-sugar epimerase